MGSRGYGNLCKGPSAALHPSSQVTEFTSLIIGSNRKVIGIECCHRINVSQLHINVSALLYCLCSRNTVASKRYLSGIKKPSPLAHPASREEAQASPPASGPGASPTPHLPTPEWAEGGRQTMMPQELEKVGKHSSSSSPPSPEVICHPVAGGIAPSFSRAQRRKGRDLGPASLAATMASTPGTAAAKRLRLQRPGETQQARSQEQNISRPVTVLEMKSTVLFWLASLCSVT